MKSAPLSRGAHWTLGLAAWLLAAWAMVGAGVSHAAEAGDNAASALQAGESPVQTVEAFQSALATAAVMEPCSARVSHLSAAVDALFDMPGIAQRVLRRHWAGLEIEARRAFVQRLHTQVALGYAANFKARDPQFDTAQLQRQQGQRAQVQSALMRADKPPVPFSYLLESRDGAWQIVNVVVEGVSELSLRSAQYGDLIEQEGFDALLDRMNGQIEETRKTCE